MASVRGLNASIFKFKQNLLNLQNLFKFTVLVRKNSGPNEILKKPVLKDTENLPVEIENPFSKENPKCILCKYNIEPDFRNVRLLSQFQSRFTGRVYGRHITGLCKYKQEVLVREIKKAQIAGLMGIYCKNPIYLADPDLYDPNNPFKPHPY